MCMELKFFVCFCCAEILAGKVFFQNNNLLCYENTIDWEDINPQLKPPVTFMQDSNDYKRQCESGHATVGWGETNINMYSMKNMSR